MNYVCLPQTRTFRFVFVTPPQSSTLSPSIDLIRSSPQRRRPSIHRALLSSKRQRSSPSYQRGCLSRSKGTPLDTVYYANEDKRRKVLPPEGGRERKSFSRSSRNAESGGRQNAHASPPADRGRSPPDWDWGPCHCVAAERASWARLDKGVSRESERP